MDTILCNDIINIIYSYLTLMQKHKLNLELIKYCKYKSIFSFHFGEWQYTKNRFNISDKVCCVCPRTNNKIVNGCWSEKQKFFRLQGINGNTIKIMLEDEKIYFYKNCWKLPNKFSYILKKT